MVNMHTITQNIQSAFTLYDPINLRSANPFRLIMNNNKILKWLQGEFILVSNNKMDIDPFRSRTDINMMI